MYKRQEKNLDALLAAYEAVRSQRADTRLLLVGDGPMRDVLRSRCPQAIFAGHRSGEDLAAHYASADVFLFPSLTETFGNVTTEAMASGLPVVAFNSAAAAQLIQHGRNGVLAAGVDLPAFVRAALPLASDAGLRASLGAAARETACRIDWRSVVSRFEAILSQVIDCDSPALMPSGVHARAMTIAPVTLRTSAPEPSTSLPPADQALARTRACCASPASCREIAHGRQ